MISYRDYLIQTASRTAGALTESITLALEMDFEESAIHVLEDRLDTVAALAAYRRPNPETVEARPVDDAG